MGSFIDFFATQNVWHSGVSLGSARAGYRYVVYTELS